MTVLTFTKKEWHAFFDRIAKGLVGKRAEIEVASLPLGRRIAAEWLPLLGITYEPKEDLLEVALDGVDHMIAKPQAIRVDIENGELASFEVIDGDGNAQMIRLRTPLMLPSPTAAGD